ncbi:hypothetical protein [Thermovibrio sp.]
MDWGVLTAVVAALFTAIGIGIGFFLAKVLKKEEKPDYSILEGKVEASLSRLQDTLRRVDERLSFLREDTVSELKKEVSSLEEEVKKLKEEISNLPLSPATLEAIEKAEELLRELNFNVPSIDYDALTKVKDNLLIVRNDVQSLLQIEKEKKREEKASKRDTSQLLTTVDSALKLAKEINRAFVRGELLSLAASIKGDLGKELVKELDNQALSSKEIVVLLEELKKEMSGEKV